MAEVLSEGLQSFGVSKTSKKSIGHHLCDPKLSFYETLKWLNLLSTGQGKEAFLEGFTKSCGC